MNLPANLKKIVFQTVKHFIFSDFSSDNNKELSRKGNTNWCACGHCQAMETEIENFCCRDTNEAPDNYFEDHKCITKSEGFKVFQSLYLILHCHSSIILEEVRS